MNKMELGNMDTTKDIDIKGLIETLNSIDQKLFRMEGNTDGIGLYFIEKKSTDGRYKYYSYKPSISPSIQDKMKEITISRLLKVKKLIEEKNYTQGEYNPSGQLDEVVETCDAKFVKSLDDLTLSMDKENHLEKMMDVNDIHTYCFQFKHKNKRVLVLRRLSKMKRLREGFLGSFIDGTFREIDGEILGVDNDIDLVLYEGRILILNHISLERIFDLEQQFKSEAKRTFDMIESQNVISNFSEFEADALNNIPAVKRLTKIGANGTLPLFFDNFSKVVEVSKAFGLGITFNKDESKIIYEDKSQIAEITLLMNDSYYKTLIGNKPGKDMLK